MCEIEQFAKNHKQKLKQFVTKHSYDLSKVDDICQDVLLKAFKDYAQFKGNSSFSTWVYGIALNKCIISNRKKTPSLLPEFLIHDIQTEPHEQPESIVEFNRFIKRIEKKLRTLTKEQREALEMRELSEFSYKKIADLHGVDVGTIKSRIFRARKHLKGIL